VNFGFIQLSRSSRAKTFSFYCTLPSALFFLTDFIFPHPHAHVCNISARLKKLKIFSLWRKFLCQFIFIKFVSIPHLPLSLFTADANPMVILITIP